MTKTAEKILFEQPDRNYECSIYPLDFIPNSNEGKLLDFYRLWKKAAGPRQMPSFSDMTFELLKGWHSHIRVAEYGGDIKDPKKIKIMGEVFEKHWGKEAMYDRLNSDNPPAEDIHHKYYEYLTHIYKGNYCLGQASVTLDNGTNSEIRWIDLPLSDDEKTINHSIAAMVIFD